MQRDPVTEVVSDKDVDRVIHLTSVLLKLTET